MGLHFDPPEPPDDRESEREVMVRMADALQSIAESLKPQTVTACVPTMTPDEALQAMKEFNDKYKTMAKK